MRHEKTIKRDSGSKVKIEVEAFINDKINYILRIDVMPPEQTEWLNGHDLSMFSTESEMIEKYGLPMFFMLVTPEEIQAAKLELWEKLKPV